MRKLSFFIPVVLITIQLAAQKPFKKNTFYGELGGNGVFLSANYERQLGNKPGFGLHIGIGICDIKPFIPFGATYLLDLGNNKSFLEAGAGITLAEQNAWDDEHSLIQPRPSPYKAGFIPSLGYRHQTRYGLMWRVKYTPVFTSYRTVPFFMGIAVGWRI
jgi:hypothetical protein